MRSFVVPRLGVVLLAIVFSAVLSSAVFSQEGLWKENERGFLLKLEKRPDGLLVIKQANPDDKYSFVGDVIGEARQQKTGEWRGRHNWGGRRTEKTFWGDPDGLLIRFITDDILFVQFIDSKYQGGWVYHRQK